MNRMRNRIAAFATAAVMIFSQALPAFAFAEESAESTWQEVVSNVVEATNYYTVSFVAEGEEVASLFVNEGSAAGELPEAPELEGKTFLGWYIGDQAVTAETTFNWDTTVTAVYADNGDELKDQKENADYQYSDNGQYATVSIFGSHKENQIPEAGKSTRVSAGTERDVLEAWTVDNIKPTMGLTLEAVITGLPEGGNVSVYSVSQKNSTLQLISDQAKVGDRITLELSAKDAKGIMLVKDREEEVVLADDNTLWANEDLYLTGKMPAGGIVTAEPVTVNIAGEEILAAYDIKIYANRKQQEKGKTWKPADKKVQVHIRGDAFGTDTLNIYHLETAESRPEFVCTAKGQDGWVTFEADSFSCYAVTKTIEKIVTLGGATWRVTVTYDASAGIPDGAELDIREADGAEYQSDTEAALNCGSEDTLFYTKYLDIRIMKNDREIEPKTPVDVRVELLDAEEGAAAIEVIHFGKDGAEKIESDAGADGVVTFRTDSFSVFGFGSVLRALLSWSGAAPQQAGTMSGGRRTLRTRAAAPAATESTVSATYTMQGFSSLVRPSYENISVSVEEGLETVNAYGVSSQSVGSLSGLWMNVNVDANLQERESVALYTVENGEIQELLAEESGSGKMQVSLAETEGFALVKDSGFRRQEVEQDSVSLNGMMPKGSEVEISEAEPELDGAVLAAYDISILENGEEYQPDSKHPVSVTMAVPGIQDADPEMLHLWHIRDDGETEEITDYYVDGETVFFTATGFSVYALTEETYHRTYRFFTLDENGQYVEYTIYTDQGTTTFTQNLKDGEALVIPQLPAMPGSDTSTFTGWYEGTGPVDNQPINPVDITLETTEFDFENLPAVTVNGEETYLFARFDNYAYVVFHDQYNGTTQSFPVAMTRRGVKGSSGTATVQIGDFSVAYDDDTSENSAPSMAFYGWSYTPIITPGSETDQAGNPVHAIETDSIDITGNVDLYPIFMPIHWLNYYSGPTGSGATYIPSAYYYLDEGATSLSVPVRSGYTFDGWFTGDLDVTLDGEGKIVSETVTYGTQVSNANGNLIAGATDTVHGVSVQNGMLMLTENATIYAKWVESDVNYTIVIWRQKATDAANLADSEKTYDYAESFVLDGVTGRTVGVEDDYTQLSDGYEGFHYGRCDDSKTVMGDGSTVLNVYYDRNVHTMKFAVAPSTNTYITYVYGGRTYSDARIGNPVTYNYLTGTENNKKRIGNIEVSYYNNTYAIKIDDVWFSIASEGRYVYSASSITEPVSRTIKTITALYGSSIRSYFPIRGDNEVEYEGYTWATTERATYPFTLSTIETMPDVDVAFGGNSSGTAKTIYYYVEVENASDSDGTVFNGRNYILYKTVKHNYNYITYDEEYHPITGYVRDYDFASPAFVYSSQRGGYTADIGSGNVNYLYYDRDTFEISFLDSYTNMPVFIGGTSINNQLNDIGIKFSNRIADYLPADPTPVQIAGDSVLAREGYQFTGWYTDPACSTRVFFEDNEEYQNYSKSKVLYTTMPAYNLRFYAGWETIWYKIVMNPNYGALNGSGSTWFWEPYNGEPIEEYTWVTRDYVESASGTYFYHYDTRENHGWPEEWTSAEDDDKNRNSYYTTNQGDATDQTRTFKYAENAYRYAGWYEVDPETGEETLYNFGEPVTHDTYLILHWKRIGTYHVSYNTVVTQDGETISGTIDGGDSNETLFAELDGDDYADNAEVVVSRTAKAPEGYNFIGWTIRGDDSGTVYYPGQSFVFLSKYAVTMPEGETIFLDAVYDRVSTAKIIYDANGGTIDESALDYGGPIDEAAPEPVTLCDVDAGTATIRNLVNNSEIRLSSGAGFTMEGATLIGWGPSAAYDPDTDTLFALGKDDGTGTTPTYYVDTEEPMTLYAVWEVRVYFDKNNANADWGGNWAEYTWDAQKQQYYTTAYVGSPVDEPAYVPNSSNPDERFAYWSLVRYTDSGDVATPYDFSAPVTGEMTLYGFWADAIQVRYHAVDASAATLVNMDSSWKTQPGYYRVNVGTEINLTQHDSAYINIPDGYTYAFACVSDSLENCSDAPDKVITSISYNNTGRCVQVTYANGTTADLPTDKEIYLVYYQDPLTLNIGYKVMDTAGGLENATMSGSGYPTTASAGTYVMNDQVSQPLTWANQRSYKHYSFAIGAPGATSASQLQMITSSSNSDSSRPQLRVKNTWRGYQYSVDGGSTWLSCGYDGDIQLYVVYFKTESQPTIVTINERTIGTTEDLNERFKYLIVTQQKSTRTISTEYATRSGSSSSGYTYTTVRIDEESSNSGTFTNIIDPYSIYLSDGETQSITLFDENSVDYGSWSNRTTKITVNGRRYDCYTRTVTSVTTNQRIIVEQDASVTEQEQTAAQRGFVTNNECTSGTSTQPYTWTYTTTENSETPVVTYTNTHTPLNVEVHVALVGGNGITLDDEERAEQRSFEIGLGEEKTFLTEIPADTLFTGDASYGFAGIIYGTGGENQGDLITVAGSGVEGIGYTQMYPDDAARNNIYELLLNNGDGTEELGTYHVYYLYYPLPRVQYMKESAGGRLTQIVRNSENPQNNGNTITLNGVTVTQNQLLSVGTDVFTITQDTVGTATNHVFNMPLVLDDTTVSPAELNFLRYTKLGAGNSGVTNTSDLDYTSEQKNMKLRIDGDQVKWSLDGETWNSFTGAPTVYAIYHEIGYELTITKTTVNEPEGVDHTFPVVISSNAITSNSYAVTGTGYTTVAAVPATATAPGTISLNVKNGSRITISGLGKGTYTVTENGNEAYTLSASLDHYLAKVTDGQSVTLDLNANREVELENTRKYADVTITKVFSGIDAADIPEGFSISWTAAETGWAGASGTLVETDAQISEDGLTWSWTRTNIPVGVTFTVTEASESCTAAGYNWTGTKTTDSMTVTADSESNQLRLENSYTKLTRDITVQKTWNDGENQDGIRPASVSIQLKANGENYGEPETLNAGNEWTHTWTELDQYYRGSEIAYTVEETATEVITGTDGAETYASQVTGNMVDGYTVTNTHTPETVEATVRKVWNDANDKDGIRLASLTVSLMKKTGENNPQPVIGEDEQPVTRALNAEGNWTATVTGLPKYEAGALIAYSWTEETSVLPEGYVQTDSSTEGTVTTITNTLMTETTVEKQWDDAENADRLRPEELSVGLYQQKAGDSEATSVMAGDTAVTVTLNDANEWSATVENLPKYDGDNEIVYSWQETEPDGYKKTAEVLSASGTKTTLTNSQITSVTVTKDWQDNGNQDGIRPASVSIQLMSGEDPVGEAVTLNDTNSWTYTWTDLIRYEETTPIVYTVEEVTDEVITGSNGAGTYSINVTGSMAEGYTVTNTHTPETVTVTVTKNWDDAEDQDGKRPASLTVNLFRQVGDGAAQAVTDTDGNAVTSDLDADGNWTATVEGLPKYENGQLIAYSWTENTETLPTGYTQTGNTTENNVTTITNSYTPETTEATVTKVWADNDNQSGKRPTSLTVNLMKPAGENVTEPVTDGSGEPITVTLNEANQWTATVPNLAKYAAGTLIGYSWEEAETDEYKLTNTAVNGTVTTLTNTYTPGTREVTVTKTFSGLESNSHIPNGFAITTNIAGYENLTLAGSTLEQGVYRWTIPEVQVGTEITLEETGFDHPWYSVNTTPDTSDNGKVQQTLTVADTGANQANFTNSYTRKIGTVEVKKIVSGNMGDRSDTFTFKAEIKYTNGTTAEETFTLQHGGNKKFENLPWGTEITITETSNPEYITSSGTDEEHLTSNQYEVTINPVADTYYTVTFENNKEVKVDTGVPMDRTPYLMLLGLIPLALLTMALGARQRRRMEAAFDAPQAGNGGKKAGDGRK